MGKVLLIGGSPMVGKSSVAAKIAAMFEINSLSTDDIGELLQTVADINPMSEMNYLDYYASKSFEALVEDMKVYHKAMEPAIQKMIDIHSEWGKKEKYLARSLWQNQFLEKECRAKNMKYIKIDGTEAVETLVGKVLALTSIRFT